MTESRRNRRRLLTGIVAAAVFFLAVFLYQRWDYAREAETLAALDDSLPAPWTVEIDGKNYGLRHGVETCLIIGIDKESDRLEHLDPEARLNNLQSDFLLLLVVDRDDRSVTALQINRDTMAEIPRLSKEGLSLSPVTEQLALSHTYGTGGRDSCLNTLHAVSHLLYDLPVDHYISVTMDAVPVIADLVGGVSVYVEDDFSAVTPELPQGQSVVLTGKLALTFVRERNGIGDSSNLNRMNRQQVFLYSLRSKLDSLLKQDSAFALTFAEALSPYLLSDIIPEEFASMLQQSTDYRFSGIESVPGRNMLGEKYMEFYPNEPKLKELLVRLLLKQV